MGWVIVSLLCLWQYFRAFQADAWLATHLLFSAGWLTGLGYYLEHRSDFASSEAYEKKNRAFCYFLVGIGLSCLHVIAKAHLPGIVDQTICILLAVVMGYAGAIAAGPHLDRAGWYQPVFFAGWWLWLIQLGGSLAYAPPGFAISGFLVGILSGTVATMTTLVLIGFSFPAITRQLSSAWSKTGWSRYLESKIVPEMALISCEYEALFIAARRTTGDD